MKPFALLLSCLCSVGAVHLTLDVSQNGTFNISHDGTPWLTGSEYRVDGLSTSDGSLVMIGEHEHDTGTDALGSYASVTLRWAKAGTSNVLMHTSFRKYHDDDKIVFEQFFPRELQTFQTKDFARTVFPGFDRHPKNTDRDWDVVAFHSLFPSPIVAKVSNYSASHMGGVPVMIYDGKDPALPMAIFSPLSEPMAHHMTSDNTFFGAGVKGTVEIIPAGWSQLFILSAHTGVNAGWQHWGDHMLAYTGKPRANMYHDTVHSTIGFWTDNGGYYHYSTGVNKSVLYEDILPLVKEYHDSIGVPFGHWQFDSWFYPKDGGVSYGTVTNWTAMPSVFPHGMAYMHDKLKVPAVMHNRCWSPHSDYIKNLDFEWYVSNTTAVPKDPMAFFAWFFKQQEGWGLSMYEQDWMNQEYDSTLQIQTNITLGGLWLHGMATGALNSNRTVQYCMPYAHEILSAAAYPAVTNARATGDYVDPSQWQIGVTSMFYWGIGILPFKDGFYSSTNKQTGGETERAERNPDRQAIIATLSCAIVGPMDGIYLLNASRVMTTCRKDGVVLKPSRPVSTSDACFRMGHPLCLVYTTYTDVAEYGRVQYYYNDAADSVMTADMVSLSGSNEVHVVHNWYSREVSLLNEESNILVAGYEGHVYATVSPVRGKWAFLGEVDKYVPTSSMRFSSVSSTDSALTAEVVGVASEQLNICACEVTGNDLRVVCISVSFEQTETKTITFQ